VPTLFLPVGTPGVDHGGHLVRCDSVVMLPLQPVRHLTLPSVAETVNALLAELQRLDAMEVAA